MLIVRLKNDDEKDVLYVRFLSNEEIGIELEKFKKLMEESNYYKNDRKPLFAGFPFNFFSRRMKNATNKSGCLCAVFVG